MNEELIDQIKDELVMLGLFKPVTIEDTAIGVGILVKLDGAYFFRVTEKDDNYFLYRRMGPLLPVLETKDFAVILLRIREWVLLVLSNERLLR